jgi:flagellar protein FlaG
MKVIAAPIAGASLPKVETSVEKAENSRKPALLHEASTPEEQKGSVNKVRPEEILNKIKALTDDGAFSVRFEMHAKTNQLIVRVVDSESGEVIRQLPPEEMLELAARLEELSGNIVNARN